MNRRQYLLISKTICQTIRFLNRSNRLTNDDLDEIKNQSLLKLTPHLDKILRFESLHLLNFIRKTTRCVFWDYLKNMSADLSQFRLKKRIKFLLHHLDQAKSQFKRPDNDSPWFIQEPVLLPDLSPQVKQIKLVQVLEKYLSKTPAQEISFSSDQFLSGLVEFIFQHIDFGVSVNELFSALAAVLNIEELTRSSLDSPGDDSDDDGAVDIMDFTPAKDIPALDLGVDEQVFYENYAEEFLKKRVKYEQTLVYFLRFVENLDYKEIEEKFHINIKTAESRLSLKPAKKGFLWRLAQFVKDIGLTVDESKNFFFILDRKIGELYSNTYRDEV